MLSGFGFNSYGINGRLPASKPLTKPAITKITDVYKAVKLKPPIKL